MYLKCKGKSELSAKQSKATQALFCFYPFITNKWVKQTVLKQMC